MGETPPREASLSFFNHLPTTQDAVTFALEHHGDQRRAADGARFVLHPLEVAAMLQRFGYPDHVVAAAVLHDVIEDTDADRTELEARFGPEVGELVALVSDDDSVEDEEERKDRVRERVREAGDYAAVVYAADKVSKARELRTLIARGGDQDEANAKFERYRRSLEMLEEIIPGSQLLEVLRFELEALEKLPPAEAGHGS